MLIEKIPIVPEIMRIDTRTQAIDMQQIGNRRFLFNPKTGVLVLRFLCDAERGRLDRVCAGQLKGPY